MLCKQNPFYKKSKLSSYNVCTPIRSATNTYTLKAGYMRAFSLLEFIIVLSVVGIVAGFAAPSFNKIIATSQVNALQAKLQSAIYLARSAAVSQKETIAFCPYAKSGCSKNWSNGAMIFTDKNNNQLIDNDDILLETITLYSKNFNVDWRASAGRKFLRFSPSGMAKEFGRFTLCYKNNDLSLARSLVINRQGRLRAYRDRNHDGIVEDVNGRQADC